MGGGGICRWLDESDGATGIEQELILSDILVADEEDKQEQSPGISGGGVRRDGSICRWLDESDGATGIEQELILSDILVADEVC